jgi:hypothetical protein
MELWFLLNEQNKERLAEVYKLLSGKKFVPPKHKQDKAEDQLETLPEIQEMMEEAPPYTISVQGRQ